jgi:hypothetical protein
MDETDNRRRKFKRDFSARECKPFNFHMLTGERGGRKSPLKLSAVLETLEKTLLKSVLSLPPDEQAESLNFVRTFEGKERYVINLWYAEMKGNAHYSAMLMRACGIRRN